jgi:hypothetical protein
VASRGAARGVALRGRLRVEVRHRPEQRWRWVALTGGPWRATAPAAKGGSTLSKEEQAKRLAELIEKNKATVGAQRNERTRARARARMLRRTTIRNRPRRRARVAMPS